MFSRETAQIWEAMDIGPLWLARQTKDPLIDDMTRMRLEKSASTSAPKSTSLLASQNVPPPKVVSAPQQAPVSVTASMGMSPEMKALVAQADWMQLESLALSCELCAMSKTRQHVVFSQGAPGAPIVLVGEAPGGEEDLQGIPFVGKSGQLLTAMLDTLGLVRGKDVALINVLKCRPPANRNPTPEEVSCCDNYLQRQLVLLKPRIVVLLGRFALQTVLHAPGLTMSAARGRVHSINIDGEEIPAIASYHPSYLLRSPSAKSLAWEDLVLLKREMIRQNVIPCTQKTES